MAAMTHDRTGRKGCEKPDAGGAGVALTGRGEGLRGNGRGGALRGVEGRISRGMLVALAVFAGLFAVSLWPCGRK